MIFLPGHNKKLGSKYILVKYDYILLAMQGKLQLGTKKTHQHRF
jgi:hypothetical protein